MEQVSSANRSSNDAMVGAALGMRLVSGTSHSLGTLEHPVLLKQMAGGSALHLGTKSHRLEEPWVGSHLGGNVPWALCQANPALDAPLAKQHTMGRGPTSMGVLSCFCLASRKPCNSP